MSDRESIQRLKNGDIGGLETLIARYQLKAVRAAYFIVQDEPTAEDIVQDTYLRIMDYYSMSSSGGGGGGLSFTSLPEGISSAEAYQKFMEALGYTSTGPWRFTLEVNP